jgi:hypothetical protein
MSHTVLYRSLHAETQTSIWLASHLVRVPNSRSGGHEFKSPMRRELGALTKSGKTIRGQVFLQYEETVLNVPFPHIRNV